MCLDFSIEYELIILQAGNGFPTLGQAMLFYAIYVGLYLLADIISILCNPRLRWPK